ncbi:MAG: Asp-tRNA(Asn)/Glu-tRNA(Gln) amidotransferase subunit GatB [Bacteroidota bacterium]
MVDASTRSQYQPVIGLEIHIQLKTHSKIFSTEGFGFGNPPNHHISPITLAHPGALPFINEQAIHYAIKLGVAMNCEIRSHTFFDRKNYFYPDLPKGYQISQDRAPICMKGYLEIFVDGAHKRVNLDHIHLEEDAGKSIHTGGSGFTQVDLNRAGTGLLEMVTEPDLRSAAEACAFATEIRKLARYLEVSEGDMEKGHLRCDANVSVMKHRATAFGTRVEIKNLNSISFMGKAIEHEIDRQIELLEKGGTVMRQTRTWVAEKGITAPMRDKETADDYRYFPEPDLLPVTVTKEQLEGIRASLPELPQSRMRRYQSEWKIPYNEATALVEDRALSDFFEALSQQQIPVKAAASWMLGPVKTVLNEKGIEIDAFPISVEVLSDLIALVDSGKITHDAAKKFVFPALLLEPHRPVEELAESLDVLVDTKGGELKAFIKELIQKHPEEVKRYLGGKKGLIGFFVGKVMKAFKGKADPKEVNKLLLEQLSLHKV